MDFAKNALTQPTTHCKESKMKLTTSRQQWVKNRIIKYCNEMQCEPPSLLLLTRGEWQEYAAYRKQITGRTRYRNSSSCTLGICNHKTRVIAIFVKRALTTKGLDNTIRHELVHLVRRCNHRSDRFKQIMQLIKKGKFVA